MDVLLAELYLSDAVVESLSQTELMLHMLDPEMQGMTVTETTNSIVCTIGDTIVFQKTEDETVTEISAGLPITESSEISFLWRVENTGDTAELSASLSVTEGKEVLLSLWAEGEGLPVEGSLGGEGYVTVGITGSELMEETAALTFAFLWSRTADALPYTLDLAVDWLHPETDLPAISLYFSAALKQSDESALPEIKYEWKDFFSLNSVSLEDYKERWGLSLGAYLLPVVLEMNIGLIDDVMNFMLDTDIFISLVE